MKLEFEKTAMAIQGSGWVYLARNGKIKTISNHEMRSDIILLIDFWEHAWSLDYQADKAKYLKNIWRAIDWSVINDRINLDNT
jgi:Fe-Mn family superoxide dismutase